MRHLAPLLLALVVASPALAQEEAPPSPEAAAQAEVARGPQPFGANLFSGNYAAERENGLNPDYRILPGDRVMVNAWGAVTINDVFAVDLDLYVAHGVQLQTGSGNNDVGFQLFT